jgi:RNA polymerase sigma-70 factor (ECF subfamily)
VANHLIWFTQEHRDVGNYTQGCDRDLFSVRFQQQPRLIEGRKIVISDQQAADSRRTEEFMELYSACERRLYVYIVSLIGNPWDAYDILQETSLILWQKFDLFRQGSQFLAWAREIARLRVLRYRRLHVNNTLLLQTEALDALVRQFDNGTSATPDRVNDEALVDCVKALRDGDRELIQLRYTAGISVQALAEKLGRSVNAVSHSLGRIRRLLRVCVEDIGRQRQMEED